MQRRIWIPKSKVTLWLLFAATPSLALAGRPDSYIGFSAYILQAIWHQWLQEGNPVHFMSLVHRLETYSKLKGNSNAHNLPADRWLTPGAYEVLLGALKKVETKAGHLLVVLSLTLGISVNVLLGKCGGSCSAFEAGLLYVLIYIHTLPVVILLKCFSHSPSWKLVPNESAVEREMIEALIEKETSFYFAFQQAFVIAVAVVLATAFTVRL